MMRQTAVGFGDKFDILKPNQSFVYGKDKTSLIKTMVVLTKKDDGNIEYDYTNPTTINSDATLKLGQWDLTKNGTIY
jgi:hypothetical protein